MSHSTLTWFSSQFKPQHSDELFILASFQRLPFTNLYLYLPDTDEFVQYAHSDMRFLRKDIGWWAYVPTQVDFHETLEKQSQTPTE